MKKVLCLVLSLCLVLCLAVVSAASTSVTNAYVTYAGGDDRTDANGEGVIYVDGVYGTPTLHIPFTALSDVSGDVTVSLSVSIDSNASTQGVTNSVIPFSSYQSMPFYNSSGTLLFNVPVVQTFNVSGTVYSLSEFESYLDYVMPTSVDYVQIFTLQGLASHSDDFADVAEIRLFDSANATDQLYLSVSYDLVVQQDSGGMGSLFSSLGNYIVGIFRAVTSVISSIPLTGVLAAFMWYLPLAAVALGLIFKIIGKRRRSRRGRR